MDKILAVVVPAYRTRFLREALESLARQTHRGFRVYIGDDFSPEDLGAVVADYADRLDVSYTRFEENFGGRDLVDQWERCIRLSQNEPWIWLFSDDDVAEDGCVARFYEALAQDEASPVDLYRFQMEFIDETGRRFDRPAEHPASETCDQLMTALLADPSRHWRAPDHIFSRKVYRECGGFVRFPKALFTDLASWLAFSSPAGVRSIPHAKLLWRSHGQGISSGMRDANRVAWLDALFGYLTWMKNFAARKGPNFTDIFETNGPTYLLRILCQFQPALTSAERSRAIDMTVEIFGVSKIAAGIRLDCWLLDAELRPRIRHWPFVHALEQLRKKIMGRGP